jgi:hypothetical protein
MQTRIRIIKREAVQKSGSYEVRLPGGNRVFLYWNDERSRRLRPEQVSGPGAGKSVCARRARRPEMIKLKPLDL